MPLEDHTAPLTVFTDPRTKVLLERICAERDTTPLQVVRWPIRRCTKDQMGLQWSPADPNVAGQRAGTGI